MRKPIVTHHLEMTNPSQLVPARKPYTGFSLVQVEIPCPALNRFLYTTVGGDWYWIARLGWSYAQWQTYLDHPNALPGYQARGFRVFNIVHTEEDLPEQSPGPWPGAFP